MSVGVVGTLGKLIADEFMHYLPTLHLQLILDHGARNKSKMKFVSCLRYILIN